MRFCYSPITLCADVWTKRGMSESFLGITAHSLTQSFQTCIVTLAVRSFENPHTSVRVRSLVEKVLDEWQISPNRILFAVTDNGSNMVAAFKEVLIQLNEDEEEDAVDFAVDQLSEEDESHTLNGTLCSKSPLYSQCTTSSS